MTGLLSLFPCLCRLSCTHFPPGVAPVEPCMPFHRVTCTLTVHMSHNVFQAWVERPFFRVPRRRKGALSAHCVQAGGVVLYVLVVQLVYWWVPNALLVAHVCLAPDLGAISRRRQVCVIWPWAGHARICTNGYLDCAWWSGVQPRQTQELQDWF